MRFPGREISEKRALLISKSFTITQNHEKVYITLELNLSSMPISLMNIFTFAIKPVWKFTSFYMRHAFKPMLYTYLLQGHLNILNCPHLGGAGGGWGNPAAFTSCASLVLLTTSLISSVHSQVPSSLVSSPPLP